MPLIVADTSILLPAFLSARPQGFKRRLLVLAAYGGLALQELQAREEIDLLMQQTEQLGGTVGGASLDQYVEALEHERARFAERLPHGTPDDFALIGAKPLYDEVERKVRERGRAINPGLPDDAPEIVRRQFERLTAATALPPFDINALPQYTEDREDDFLVAMALMAGAILITDDTDIVPRDDEVKEYEDPDTGERIQAWRFNPFIGEFVQARGVDLDEIDSELLYLAVSP